MEHIASLTALIENARSVHSPLFVTFLDLANAFGSVSHQFIHDMLTLIQLPASITGYLHNLYSKLQAFVSTPLWNTDTFAIQRGVFQGDTISPIIFLLCFEPLVKLATQDPSKGYVPRIAIPGSDSLPPVGSTIYLFWDEEPSPEPPGWYKCHVSNHTIDGLSTVTYPMSSTEVLNLHGHKWELARANAAKYLPSSRYPPHVALPQVREKIKVKKFVTGQPHCAKAFADDLSIISSNKTNHQSTLDSIQTHSTSLDLVLKPPKCLSFCFSGKTNLPDQCFCLGDKCTTNVSSKPAKFLSRIIGASSHQTEKSTTKKLKDEVLTVMNRIDKCIIRGEFKVWIYQHYFVPSLRFLLCVSSITGSQIASIQRHITRFLKSWLALPNCATLASIFHPHSLAIKYLPHYQEEAQLTLLHTINSSSDPLICDIGNISRPPLSAASLEAIEKAKEEITSNATSSNAARRRKAKENLLAAHSSRWNYHLGGLQVQKKLVDVIALEESSPVWQRLMFGLPAGQLSFLIRSSIDSLPTPTSLARWNMKVSPSCPLCHGASLLYSQACS
jgi:hypothetical protein